MPQQREPNHFRASHQLYPFPDGWFIVGPSRSLPPETLHEKIWMGRPIIIWRDSDQIVCVADAHCPHLGAHMGPASGGTICDGKLICPFHGFQYDTEGKCVATPNTPPPRSARLSCYKVVETHGLIFAYYSTDGHAPSFKCPTYPDSSVAHAIRTLRITGHPQATSENSVDFAHLGHVHGYQSLERLKAVTIDGKFLYASYGFTRLMLNPLLKFMEISVEIDITVAGLGVSVVQVRGKNGLRV